MWFERFNIIVQSLTVEFDPAAWGPYNFSWIDVGITVGSFGWFFCFLLVFIKVFPSVSLTEVKEVAVVPGAPAHH